MQGRGTIGTHGGRIFFCIIIIKTNTSKLDVLYIRTISLCMIQQRMTKCKIYLNDVQFTFDFVVVSHFGILSL